MRRVKGGVVQLIVGRKVLVLNKITSDGWNGSVIVFPLHKARHLSQAAEENIECQKGRKIKWW